MKFGGLDPKTVVAMVAAGSRRGGPAATPAPSGPIQRSRAPRALGSVRDYPPEESESTKMPEQGPSERESDGVAVHPAANLPVEGPRTSKAPDPIGDPTP